MGRDMNGIIATLATIREIWIGLALSPIEKTTVKMVLITSAMYVIVYLAERAAGTRTNNYRSRAFAQDLSYWIYYRAGIDAFLIQAAIIAALERPLSFVDVGLLTDLPFAAHILLMLLVADFAAYWIHRAEHRFKFMWAFHTTHHAQQRLTFATIARFHPVEALYHSLLAYIPLRILGIDPMSWMPMYLFVQLHSGLQHTQIPWKLGPLYRIIATPHFHAFHHSIDPAHYDRNFSNMFSFWDYLFGTAIKSAEPRPTGFGLSDIECPSLLSSLTTPFRLLRLYYVDPLWRRVGKTQSGS